MKILFIGDIVGEPGRQAVTKHLLRLKSEHGVDFVIANGENSAGGMGITTDVAEHLLSSGVDVITLGNHAWSKRDIYPYLDDEPRILRPANYPNGVPGRGYSVYQSECGTAVGVINLCGRVFMDHLENPFRTADEALEAVSREAKVILIDFHGEATSEKIAFGWYVDGRASAVLGTHTHVQTADERVLPGGSAYITDVGMTGPRNSVIGVKKEIIISRFLTNMPNKFEIANGEIMLCGVLVQVDPLTGKAESIERLQVQ
ncbi:MAG: TIGR00282 family metallophosphoesterase [Armatimonadota bacterium]